MRIGAPKVSVIVPVYGVEKYIEESIRSICEQEYQNIEIILVNDGTPDLSVSLAKKVAADYSVTFFVVNKDNGGLPSARNTGIKAATGEYICFIDSDDMISANHILNLVNACEKYKTKVAYADFQLTCEENRCGVPSMNNTASSIQHEALLRGFLVRSLKIHCCALLIDRKYLMDQNLWFNESLRYGEDIDFMWRLFPKLSAIAYTGNSTYLYLQRPGSLMTAQSMERVITLLDVFKITVNQLLLEYPKDETVLKYLYGKAALAFYRTFAETSSYELFKVLLKKTSYRRNVWKVMFVGNLKLSLLTMIFLISPRCFALIVKENKKALNMLRLL